VDAGPGVDVARVGGAEVVVVAIHALMRADSSVGADLHSARVSIVRTLSSLTGELPQHDGHAWYHEAPRQQQQRDKGERLHSRIVGLVFQRDERFFSFVFGQEVFLQFYLFLFLLTTFSCLFDVFQPGTRVADSSQTNFFFMNTKSNYTFYFSLVGFAHGTISLLCKERKEKST